MSPLNSLREPIDAGSHPDKEHRIASTIALAVLGQKHVVAAGRPSRTGGSHICGSEGLNRPTLGHSLTNICNEAHFIQRELLRA